MLLSVMLPDAVSGATHVDMVESDDGFILLENHRDVADGMFSSDVKVTGVENADDSSANTYCVIGAINPSAFQFDDGSYSMKLIYRYDDGSNDTLEWTQTSWITE